jgi:hypothetical protein
MTNADYKSLCARLLKAIDAGNPEAEESILCQIRVALREDIEESGKES